MSRIPFPPCIYSAQRFQPAEHPTNTVSPLFGDLDRTRPGFDQKPNADAPITINVTCGTAITITATAGSSITINTSTPGSTAITVTPITLANPFTGSTSTTHTEPERGSIASISAMPVYKEKNHEELLWEHYRLGNKGGQNPAGENGFGISSSAPATNVDVDFPSTSSSSPFGQTPSSRNPFITTTSLGQTSSPFSSTPETSISTSSSPFGQTSSSPNPFPAPFFGQASSPFTSRPATSIFQSSSPFGQTSSSQNPLSRALSFSQTSSPFGQISSSPSPFSNQGSSTLANTFNTSAGLGNSSSGIASSGVDGSGQKTFTFASLAPPEYDGYHTHLDDIGNPDLPDDDDDQFE